VRKCLKCEEYKSDELFGADKSRLDNRHPYCRLCRNSFEKQKRQEGKRREKRKKRSPELQRKYMLKCRYNLEIEEYNKKLNAQNNLCAICFKSMSDPCVDHEHESGKVRGLLCRTCNFGLGAFKDNWKLLKRAAEYLCKPCHKKKSAGEHANGEYK
jgi:hypothetical protein